MEVRKPLWKRVVRIVLIVLLVLVVLVALLVLYLSVTEYKPQESEKLNITAEVDGQKTDAEQEQSDNPNSSDSGGTSDSGNTSASGKLPSVKTGDTMSIVTWNVGYGALGDNADFFMDGGKSVYTADEERVRENIDGINSELKKLDPDFAFLQEADVNSDRSRHINEVQKISDAFAADHDGNAASTFAYNFKVNFIPCPLPPIGKVESGILTLSACDITDSTRIQLPCPFQWPVRVANLKRCLMVDRIPVEDADGKDTGRELVLVNLHLEAYDSGEGKAAQTAMLREVLQSEADKGNYVIAGGDFNQTFSGVDDSMYPEYEGRWHCGEIDESDFDSSWQFLMDNQTPSCRSLDQSYKGKDDSTFQFYLIDGFIVSSNVEAENVQTQDLKFQCSDHNPVRMTFHLR